MTASLKRLYETRDYPAMSHPVADPAVTAVAATLAGLRTPPPAKARMLEIGCSSGHHLMALASRWPECDGTGIDLSETAVATAAERALEARLGNVRFIAGDFRGFQPDRGYDYIIAHGVFSWVPDEVKIALLDFCRRHLSPSGIAVVSFNVSAGWADRWPLIEAAKRLQAERDLDEVAALSELLRNGDPEDAGRAHLLRDMIAKGPAVLPFDDFAPVNDPWPFDRFIHAAARAGLQWLGEADPAQNLPAALDESAREHLREIAMDPLRVQLAIDRLTRRTFRSAVLCRNDAPVMERNTCEDVFEFAVRTSGSPAAGSFAKAVERFSPQALPVKEIGMKSGEEAIGLDAAEIDAAILSGELQARIEPVRFDPEPPAFPKLNAFRRMCAARSLPLVDAYLQPCTFPEAQNPLLRLMDGACSLERIEEQARAHCPKLMFDAWIRHLAGRGMFMS